MNPKEESKTEERESPSLSNRFCTTIAPTEENPRDVVDKKGKAERAHRRNHSFQRIEPSNEPRTDVPASALLRPNSEQTDNPSADSEGIFLVTQQHRVSEATDGFCLVMTFLEIAFFVVYPAVTIFALGNWQIGLLFLFVAGIYSMRYYVNATCVIAERGTMMVFAKPDANANAERRWADMSRLSEIVGTVTNDESRIFWIGVFGILFVIWISIFLAALGESSASHFDHNFTYLDNFYYPPHK